MNSKILKCDIINSCIVWTCCDGASYQGTDKSRVFAEVFSSIKLNLQIQKYIYEIKFHSKERQKKDK